MTKFIFSINTGRSGSAYLATLFQHVDSVRSFHEPEPTMTGKPLRQFLNGNEAPMKQLMENKIKSINSLKNSAEIYVETSPSFIKGFGWLISEFYPEEEIGVIILKRNIEKIIESTHRIWSTPLTELGRDWLITPEANYNLVPFPHSFPKLRYYFFYALRNGIFRTRVTKKLTAEKKTHIPMIENYEKEMIRWYVKETWARAERFKIHFPRMKYYEVTMEELNSPEKVEEMIEFFGIPKEQIKNSIYTAIGKPVNSRR